MGCPIAVGGLKIRPLCIAERTDTAHGIDDRRTRRRLVIRTGSVWAVLAAMAVVGMGLWVVAPAALAQPAFQAPPVLRARELLPPDMLAGPHFQVDDRVPEERELVGAVRPGEVARAVA